MPCLRHDPLALRRFALSVGDLRLVDALDGAFARDARRAHAHLVLSRLTVSCGVSSGPADRSRRGSRGA
jgi:hypothetical protein